MKPVIYGTLAGWLNKVPRRIAMIEGLGFVYTDAGTAPSLKMRVLRIIVSKLYRLALARAHRVIFLNSDDLKEFVQKKIINPHHSVVLGGIGVDLVKWHYAPAPNTLVRFLFIGRLLREKGIEHFVVAARQIKKIFPEVEFVVLGDVDSNPGAINVNHMRKWVAEGVIKWPGHVPVKPWLEQTSVFVLPSYREGVSLSTQEAMAIGRAVITTNVPGCRQTVDDGVNGFLVPVRNSEALVVAMKRFIEEPELITSMGFESRRMAEERFDVHKVNAKLIEILGMSEVVFDGVVSAPN